MIDPRALRPGDIIDDHSNYGFHLHFVEEVRKGGCWLELLFTPTTWPRTGNTYYNKHTGHGGFVPFEREFYSNPKLTIYGRIPALIGQRSLKICANEKH